MQEFDINDRKKLYNPPKNSHKGQNGKLLIIGGSELFHSASLWALKVASRIVDMVFYSSIPQNNEIVLRAKEEFRDGIVVPRGKIEDYINEADCILIGPGLPRKVGQEVGDDDTKELTEKLIKKYQGKKWVIDGGSLQVLSPEILMLLREPILTPHIKEFELLKLKIKNEKLKMTIQNLKLEKQVKLFAKEFKCVILLKGQIDIICSSKKCIKVPGGNAGMTKGGTGDVLAGLVASLYCKNDAFLAACAGSYINKKAGESLFKKVGYFFNASDLADAIPQVMKKLLA
ncbi:MAG: NAD(P)H-hydrate dehydratase [Candidatus Levybacteria bacterium]|nr:NAD(P)H-hydrate dehydratase [Candidatus Levybacteria bacterium]